MVQLKRKFTADALVPDRSGFWNVNHLFEKTFIFYGSNVIEEGIVKAYITNHIQMHLQ